MIILLADKMHLDIKSCARCKQDHDNLEFASLTHPIEDDDGTIWNYWAPCPTNGEPILMKVVPSQRKEK